MISSPEKENKRPSFVESKPAGKKIRSEEKKTNPLPDNNPSPEDRLSFEPKPETKMDDPYRENIPVRRAFELAKTHTPQQLEEKIKKAIMGPEPNQKELYPEEMIKKEVKSRLSQYLTSENFAREVRKWRNDQKLQQRWPTEESFKDHLTSWLRSHVTNWYSNLNQQWYKYTWEELPKAIERIDIKALEFIYFSHIKNGDQALDPEIERVFLARYDQDPKRAIKALETIISDLDKTRIIFRDLHHGDFNDQLKAFPYMIADFFYDIRNDEEKIQKATDYVIQRASHGFDTDTFLFSYIEAIDRLAKNHPEAKEQAEEAYLKCLEKIFLIIKRGDHGMPTYDTELPDTDLPLQYGRFSDNIYSFRIIQILQKIPEVGNRRSIDRLLQFAREESAFFLPHITDAFSEIDPNYSAERLMEFLRSDDLYTKRVASKMLYRIELGRVGVSPEGLRYLDKIYDLQEYNDPNYFVQRLTSEGEMGIFEDRTKRLVRYFKLGDLSDPQTKLKAEILDFMFETFFQSRRDESPEEHERKLRYIEELKDNYFEVVNDVLFEETGMRFNNLSFREQGWFLQLLRRSDEKTCGRIKNFVKGYGEIGVKAFTVMDYDEENYLSILDVGERLDKRTAEQIFMEYCRIYEHSSDLENIFKKTLEDDKETESLPPAIPAHFPSQLREAFLRRSQDVLISSRLVLEDGQEEVSQRDVLYGLVGIRKTLELITRAFLEEQRRAGYEVRGLPMHNRDLHPQKSSHNAYAFELKDKQTQRVYVLKVLIREEGSQEGQARIQFEVKLDTDHPDKELQEAFRMEWHNKKKLKTTHPARIRASFDLDTFYDPPRASLDIGRRPFEGKIWKHNGDIVGKVLALRSEYGHHNPVSFDPEISKPQNFARIARAFNAYTKKRMAAVTA